MDPRRHNARGFTDAIRPCKPTLCPPQGTDVRLPNIFLRRGDAAERALIGPLTKTRRRTKTGSRLHGRYVDVEPQLSLYVLPSACYFPRFHLISPHTLLLLLLIYCAAEGGIQSTTGNCFSLSPVPTTPPLLRITSLGRVGRNEIQYILDLVKPEHCSRRQLRQGLCFQLWAELASVCHHTCTSTNVT